MFRKRSFYGKLIPLSLTLVISLVLSPIFGSSIGLAAVEPSITGEPVTDLQKEIVEGIRQRAALGLPVPTVTFTTESDSGTDTGLQVQSLDMTYQPTTFRATTVIYFNGPQEAGYEEWPAIEISGNLGGVDNPFSTGDLTEAARAGVESQDPSFWQQTTFGQEARRSTITETIEQYPGSEPLLTGMSPLSSMQSISPEVSLMGSELPYTSEQILMGFTFTGPRLDYSISDREEACVTILWKKICFELYYFRAGFAFDFGFGLRLPAEVNLEQLEPATDNHFQTTLKPEDWQVIDYKKYNVPEYENVDNAEDGNELVLYFDLFAGVLVRLGGLEICPLPKCNININQDYSDTFPTPFGEGTTFPIPLELYIPIIEISAGGILTGSIGFTFSPQVTSTNIEAKLTATDNDGCEESRTISYSKPGVPVDITLINECFKTTANPITLRLEQFRYYFNKFGITLGVGVALDLNIGDGWHANYTVPLYTLDISPIFGIVGPYLYLGDHMQCNFKLDCGRTGPDNIIGSYVPPPDTTPPIITPVIVGTYGDNDWYTSDVNLSWSVVDNESNAAITSGCDTINITADQEATEYTCSASSAGGDNSVTVAIKRDATPPEITCPAAGPFLLNSGEQVIGPAGVDATISGISEGLSTLTGIVTTENVGPKEILFIATDLAGNYATSVCSYDVHFNYSGLLPPVEEMNNGKAGRTYPVKWQLADANGSFIGDLSAVESIAVETSDMCSASDLINPLAELSSSESTWRYDAVDNQYIYNWRTPGMPGCYTLTLTLTSGQTETVYFDLR